MKLNVFFVTAFLVLLSACGPSPEEAKSYLLLMEQHEKPVTERAKDMVETFTSEDPNPAEREARLSALKTVLFDHINGLKEEEDLSEEDLFRHRTLEYLLEINSIAENEATALSELLDKDKTEMTDEDSLKIIKLKKYISGKFKVAGTHLKFARSEYFEEYGLK